ncbi:MAG: hypothetical protein HC884_06125 [Chloroflexaceae bacterium]|nr:hypothetical protein [Chloroflexaceae bacterium]
MQRILFTAFLMIIVVGLQGGILGGALRPEAATGKAAFPGTTAAPPATATVARLSASRQVYLPIVQRSGSDGTTPTWTATPAPPPDRPPEHPTPTPTSGETPGATTTVTPTTSATPTVAATVTLSPTVTTSPSPSPTDSPSPTPTVTATPVTTPTPTTEAEGACSPNAPDELEEGPDIWMPDTSPAIGEETVVCARLVVDGQAVPGAQTEIKLKYLDYEGFPQTEVAGTMTAGSDGWGMLRFTVPETTECTVHAEVTFGGETFDRREYPERLERVFTPSASQ